MMDVSIIIVNLNTRELLLGCLRSVFADASHATKEVIVIDNGSTDGSVEMLRHDFPNVRLLCNVTNEGFAKPNNDGMWQAKGRFLFLLNSDTIVSPGTVDAMVAFLEAHPDAGACGPKLLYPDGRLQRSVGGFHTLWTHVCDMLLLDKLIPRSRLFGGGEMTTFPYDENRPCEAETLMGAAFVVRREVLEKTGMFDEDLSIYYNEMDWFLRMHSDGWKVWYVPTTTVVHYRGATAAIVNKNFRYFDEMYRNSMVFYQKHYGRGAVVLFRLMLLVGFSFRTVGWGVVRLVAPSERAGHMATYSWKTLLLGAQFWKAVPKPGAGAP
jgi:GT2 family glycosyltransferase